VSDRQDATTETWNVPHANYKLTVADESTIFGEEVSNHSNHSDEVDLADSGEQDDSLSPGEHSYRLSNGLFNSRSNSIGTISFDLPSLDLSFPPDAGLDTSEPEITIDNGPQGVNGMLAPPFPGS
jgi:hypothetical protein